MQKKVFLRRGEGKGPGGGPPYVKYLLWAILGISLAVVAVSYLLNPKTREASRRTVPEKPSVRKELPRPPESAPGETTPGIPGLAANPETPAEQAKPPEPAPNIEPQPALQPAPQPPVQPQAPVQTAKPPEPAPRDIFPKSPQSPALTQKAPPAAPAPSAQKSEKAQKPEKAEKKEQKEPAKTARTAPAPEKPETAAAPGTKPEAKAVSTAGKAGSFSVQVGCYKEKQSADEVRERLRKKGYDVSLCPSAAGGGYAYTVVTKPVSSMSKASTLAEQLKSEQKVSPTVIKSAAACGLETSPIKAAMKKPAVSKQAAKPAPASAQKAIDPAADKKAEKPAAAKKPQPAKKPLPAASAKPKTVTPAKASAAD